MTPSLTVRAADDLLDDLPGGPDGVCGRTAR